MGKKVPRYKPYSNRTYKPDDYSWHADAACVGLPTDMFYYDDYVRGPERDEKVQAALTVCMTCPVINECLTDAIARGDRYSIQGGTTPEQRGFQHLSASKDSALPIAFIITDRERTFKRMRMLGGKRVQKEQ